MARELKSLDNLRIASPCPASWESMTGSDSVRHCDLCNLNVYDISRMTRLEAEAFIAHTEGRICARLYRRVDGTVLTRDCPVGLRELRRRASRVAGAVFAALVSLCSSAIGQTPSKKDEKACTSKSLNISRRKAVQKGSGTPVVTGTALDIKNAIIPGTIVTVINEHTKDVSSARADGDGRFHFDELSPGSYTLKVEAPGFRSYRQKRIALGQNESLDLTLRLEPGDPEVTVTVGIIAEDPQPEPGNTIISNKTLDKIPLPH
jgi:hypothetical protein